MKVYFAGVTTNPLADAFHGFDVLESFANAPPLLNRHRPLFRSMCLDSGAYSVMHAGLHIDLQDYIGFAKQHGAAYDFVASLDDIEGGPDKNLENLKAMYAHEIDAMPTYHSGEPLSLLRWYCQRVPRLGLGMRRPTGLMPPAREVREFLRGAFACIPPTVKVHGWGMTDYIDFPFDSVDSTTWMWEMKALLAVKGQGAEAVQCLTPSEIIAIVQKKYLRQARRQLWEGLL